MHDRDWPTGRTGTNHVAGQFHTVTATSMWMCFQCYLSFSRPESFWQPSEILGFCGSKTSMAWAKRSRTLSHCLTASFWRYAAGLHLQRSEIGNSKKCPESCKASTITTQFFLTERKNIVLLQKLSFAERISATFQLHLSGLFECNRHPSQAGILKHPAAMTATGINKISYVICRTSFKFSL